MKAKEINFKFEVKRSNHNLRIARLLFVIAFIILTTTIFIYIPYITSEQDAFALQNVNDNLSNQLSVAMSEQSISESFTQQEILYNDAYDFLLEQNLPMHVYISSIMISANSLVEISSYSFNKEDKTIKIYISNSLDVDINEFILQVYENYGFIDDGDISRWIVGVPVRRAYGDNKVEVTFYYA